MHGPHKDFASDHCSFSPHCTIPQNDELKWNSIAFSAFCTRWYRRLRDHQNPIKNGTNDKALLQKASLSGVAHVIRKDKEI